MPRQIHTHTDHSSFKNHVAYLVHTRIENRHMKIWKSGFVCCFVFKKCPTQLPTAEWSSLHWAPQKIFLLVTSKLPLVVPTERAGLDTPVRAASPSITVADRGETSYYLVSSSNLVIASFAIIPSHTPPAYPATHPHPASCPPNFDNSQDQFALPILSDPVLINK